MAVLLHPRRGFGSYGRGVTASRPFWVSAPSTLANLLTGWLSGRGPKIPDLPGLEGQWVEAKGGPLATPVVARVDRAPDGRFVITGLLIGLRDRSEITWETLRGIRPATVLEQIFKDFDPNSPAVHAFDLGPGQTAFHLWASAVRDRPDVEAPQKAGGRVATDLRVFANTYLRNLAARPHGAMTATAEELHISRATAIRRADQARKAGLLPAKATKEKDR